jgi:hypothetical protein
MEVFVKIEAYEIMSLYEFSNWSKLGKAAQSLITKRVRNSKLFGTPGISPQLTMSHAEDIPRPENGFYVLVTGANRYYFSLQ